MSRNLWNQQSTEHRRAIQRASARRVRERRKGQDIPIPKKEMRYLKPNPAQVDAEMTAQREALHEWVNGKRVDIRQKLF